MPRLAPKGSRSPPFGAPKWGPLVVASFVASMNSSVVRTKVKPIVVVYSRSQIAVTASGEVAMMMSSMRFSPMMRPMAVMPGVAMIDPVARAVQHVGEDGVAVERGHD